MQIINYELRQQTPMIHFQPDDEGATLRASEVKPKLDKFIIAKIGGITQCPQGWLVGNGDVPSLDYKMRITANVESLTRSGSRSAALNKLLSRNRNSHSRNSQLSSEKIEKINRFNNCHNNDNLYLPDVYFGNMARGRNADEKVDGIISSYKEAILYTSPIKLQIVCPDKDLAIKIDSIIKEFFLVENFGCRSDKGLGSFVVDGTETKSPHNIGEYLTEFAGAKKCYCIDYSGYTGQKGSKQFKDIKKLYAVMKSGFNGQTDNNGNFISDDNKYCHSFLFDYFSADSIWNEKKFMKVKRISPWVNDKPVKHPDNPSSASRSTGDDDITKYRYVRALLGLADHIDYIVGFTRNENGGYRSNRSETGTVNISNQIIKRYASPIYFKIIGDYTYIVAKRVNKEILDKEFTFESHSTQNDTSIPNKLKVPREFDIDDFIQKYVDFYNSLNRSADYHIGKEIGTAYSKDEGTK